MSQTRTNQTIRVPTEPILEYVASQSAKWPTRFPLSLEIFLESCCALHKRVDLSELSERGCGGVKLGTHNAIVSLYVGDGVRYCHAEDGQRVLDYRLYESVYKMEGSFLKKAAFRPRSFKDRYFGGFPVEVSVYGAGYCYLALFHPTIRSRLARCLGPRALIADVVRFVVCVGEVVKPVRIVNVGVGVWHVESQSVVGFSGRSEAVGTYSLHDVVSKLVSILEKDANAIIGADALVVGSQEQAVAMAADGLEIPQWMADSVKAATKEVNESSGAFATVNLEKPLGLGFSVFPVVKVDWIDVPDFDRLVGSHRLSGLLAWFSSVGVQWDCEKNERLLVATMASSHCVGGLAFAKSQCKLWALYGDAVIRMVQAEWCIANFMTAADYSVIGASAQNVRLASKFRAVGLRDYCYVAGLSCESSKNADIAEAVIGLVGLFCDSTSLLNLLRAFDLVPHDSQSLGTLATRVGLVRHDVTSGELNSLQYARAVILMKKGLI